VWSPAKDYLFLVHRLLQNAASRHLSRLSGRILDLGCGDAPYRDLLPAGTVHVGVDWLALPGVRVRASVEALPFADQSFDGAMCTEVIELSPNPWKVISELSRVLKPGGRLYLTAPFDWHLLEPPHDYFRFTPNGVRAMLSAASFEVEEMEGVGGMFSATVSHLLENVFSDVWMPLVKAAGLKRGAYRSAALMTLPLNLVALKLAPALDRLTPRSPISIAVSAVRHSRPKTC
jgi:SAM-dependent methyltransferase